MSGPITRPLDGDEHLVDTVLKLKADQGSNLNSSAKFNSHNDNSVNKSLPYIWFNGVISAFSFGLGVCSIILVLFLANRVNVSENHWRNLEQENYEFKRQLAEMEKDHARR